MASTNNSVIPTTLLESPSFQLERLRRRTRDGVEAALQTKQTTLREYWVLTCLVDADAASQSYLSETLAIDASDMVRLIDALEDRGWAKRERDPKDRRRQIVACTKKGTKTHKDLAELVATIAGAQVQMVPNPRQESAENELHVTNDTFLELGLQPTTLSEGLLHEGSQAVDVEPEVHRGTMQVDLQMFVETEHVSLPSICSTSASWRCPSESWEVSPITSASKTGRCGR